MTCSIDIISRRRLPAKLAAGLALSAFLVLGTFAVPAYAAERGGHGGHGGGDHRGGDHRGYRGGHPGWNGGYYPAPPVVYGSPYYYPPPVVYGPSVGIVLPGLSIGIR